MSNEELIELIKKGEDVTGNMSKLYRMNQGIIFSIVKKYSYACKASYGCVAIIELEELMHEAYFGLVKAVEKYDVTQGVLFMSYAPFWIRQAIKRFLEDSGQFIRVPVHTQEKIHRYNQLSSHYMYNFNRQPTKEEYASTLIMSVKEIEQLQRFMYRNKVSSLDRVVADGDDEDISYSETVPGEVDVETEVVEKVSNQQLKDELWIIIDKILMDEKKMQLLKMKYIDNMNMEDIGKYYNISRTAVKQSIDYSLKLIKRNAQIRRLAVQTGLWDENKPFTEEKIKRLCKWGHYEGLDEKELNYAKQRGWVSEQHIKLK